MKRESFPNGCEVLSINDLNYEKIAQDSLKKDLVDWCKANREEWLKMDVNIIYEALYIPTRKVLFDALPLEEKAEYLKKGGKTFGISMDAIKNNAMIRYAIEYVKMYGSPEAFIKAHGEYAFNRFFTKEAGAKLDTRWETIVGLIDNGFD